MAAKQDEEELILPLILCRSTMRTLSTIREIQRTAMNELAVLNRELFDDFVAGVHSMSAFASQFAHARTVTAATKAVDEFLSRQEKILRKESHRWIERGHRVTSGALHPTPNSD